MPHSARLGVDPSFALPSVQGEADAVGLVAYAQACSRQTSRKCVCLIIYTILLIYDMICEYDDNITN